MCSWFQELIDKLDNLRIQMQFLKRNLESNAIIKKKKMNKNEPIVHYSSTPHVAFLEIERNALCFLKFTMKKN